MKHSVVRFALIVPAATEASGRRSTRDEQALVTDSAFPPLADPSFAAIAPSRQQACVSGARATGEGREDCGAPPAGCELCASKVDCPVREDGDASRSLLRTGSWDVSGWAGRCRLRYRCEVSVIGTDGSCGFSLVEKSRRALQRLCISAHDAADCWDTICNARCETMVIGSWEIVSCA